MKTHYETIVVGAGAAGMNCCLELQKNDREYLLISPNIGGRICNDEERHMNYGAVFYFGTYKYMLRSELLIEGPDVLPALSAWNACSPSTSAIITTGRNTLSGRTSMLVSFSGFTRHRFLSANG